jgi:hypothetical protein
MTDALPVPSAIERNARELRVEGIWVGSSAACAAALRNREWAVIVQGDARKASRGTSEPTAGPS